MSNHLSDMYFININYENIFKHKPTHISYRYTISLFKLFISLFQPNINTYVCRLHCIRVWVRCWFLVFKVQDTLYRLMLQDKIVGPRLSTFRLVG